MAQITHRLTILFFLFVCCTVATQAQKITLKGKGTLKEWFSEIEKQTGYSIAYSHSVLRLEARKEVSFNDVSFQEVLKHLLKGSHFTFKVRGKHILIVKEEAPASVPKQNIRGKVMDIQTQEPVYATVQLLHAGLSDRGVATDSLGRFSIIQLPVGRYTLKISSIGYESVTVTDVLLNSAKEAYCEVSLAENTQHLKEVIVKAPLYKDKLLNPMALTGGRMLSMEEASRYAGGFDDPARLVTSFAGVTSSGVSSNALEVRGNAPQYVQWRMEGIETPNFSHYADVTGLGGGLLTGLSSHLINHSDFLYGAFPAEYSNVLSGVFDMNMRTGNAEAFEHAFQIGIWGLDIASEGPIGQKGKRSYLFNYRYSLSAIADKISGTDEGMDYQDLAFKIHVPTQKSGTFSLWGIGLLDHLKQSYEEDKSKWELISDRQQNEFDFQKGAIGVTHHLPLPKDAYLKTTTAVTHSGLSGNLGQVDENLKMHQLGVIKNNTTDLTLNSYYNRRYSARHANRSGITVTNMFYHINFKNSPNATLYEPMKQYVRANGSNLAVSAFSNSMINFGDDWKMNIGVNAQYFSLNRIWSLEPRASLKWQFNPNQSLALAYGLHSRRERMEYYYTHVPDGKERWNNTELKLSKAHHVSLSYNWTPSPLLSVRVEPYVQYLYDIPVEPNTSFSIINFDGYILDRPLVNRGKGLNYGVDMTVDHYLDKGWYWMVSGSLFRSRYMGGDGIWRDSRTDRKFMLKALAGKEWIFGKKKHKSLSLNLRMTLQGGERYSPINYQESDHTHQVEEDESKAYALRLPASFITDLTLNYKVNRKHVSHELSLKLLNANGFKSTGYCYNLVTNQIEKKREAPIVFNISYKIYF